MEELMNTYVKKKIVYDIHKTLSRNYVKQGTTFFAEHKNAMLFVKFNPRENEQMKAIVRIVFGDRVDKRSVLEEIWNELDKLGHNVSISKDLIIVDY